MKFVPFKKFGVFESRGLLVNLLSTSPGGQNLGEMRKRLTVLTKIEDAPQGADGVSLEDAEHAALVQMLENRSDFLITSRDIIAIADAVIEAKAPLKADAA